MTLRLAQSAGVLVATLDAPATRNALSAEIVSGLDNAVARAEGEQSVRVLVIRGGGGAFSAGGDFSSFRALLATPAPANAPDPIALNNRQFGAVLERLRALAKPTLALVDGPAMGGGCGLAAACDLVVASPRALFATPEVTIGLPPAQIAPFMRARLGERLARRLMLTGERVTAAQAAAIGLVDYLSTSDEAFAADALTIVNRLLAAEPGALAATKRILANANALPFTETLDDAANTFAACLRSGTAAQGIDAFAAKQPPPWVARLESWPA